MSEQTSQRASHGERLRADILLLGATLLWGSTFVAQRTGNEQIKPFTFNALRFMLGSLILVPIVGYRRLHSKAEPSSPAPRGVKLWIGGTILGLFLFGGITFQQLGLVYTTAGKAGFITGLYVILVPLLLALFWRTRVNWKHWGGVILATTGLFLLSGSVQQQEIQLNPGDGWVLLGALVWALHIIAIGRIAPEQDPLQLALIQYAVCALLSLPLALALGWDPWDNVIEATSSIVYAGVFSTCLAFTIQVAAQRHAPPADAAIIMSLESVFAALFGWLLLGETLTPWQLVGCGLMLGGMLLAQISSLASSPKTTERSTVE